MPTGLTGWSCRFNATLGTTLVRNFATTAAIATQTVVRDLLLQPGYLTEPPPIEPPADLAGHTLLNLDGTPHAVEDWGWWLAGVGAPPPAAGDMLGFDSYANVIQAAVAGQGLALGYRGIIDLLLADGVLVRPLETALSRGQALYLVLPRTATPPPHVKSFCDWVLAEAGDVAGLIGLGDCLGRGIDGDLEPALRVGGPVACSGNGEFVACGLTRREIRGIRGLRRARRWRRLSPDTEPDTGHRGAGVAVAVVSDDHADAL